MESKKTAQSLALCALAAGVIAWGFVDASEAQKDSSLKLLATFAIARGSSPATDLRWAGTDSVYLARSRDGVEEVELERELSRRRIWFPDQRTLGGSPQLLAFSHIAASESHFVASGSALVAAWRSLGSSTGLTRFDRAPIGEVMDVDLAGDRMAWIGTPDVRTKPGTLDARGYIWVASLSQRLADRKALAELPEGDGYWVQPHWICALREVGALRYLPDGSLFAAPGFAAEAAIYEPSGRKVRSWDLRLLGLTTPAACEQESPTASSRLSASIQARADWTQGQRVIDEALVIGGTPALVVREVKEGRPRWQLLVLDARAIRTYEIPISNAGPYTRLRGDARAGKIVLLAGDWHVPGVKAPTERIFVFAES